MVSVRYYYSWKISQIIWRMFAFRRTPYLPFHLYCLGSFWYILETDGRTNVFYPPLILTFPPGPERRQYETTPMMYYAVGKLSQCAWTLVFYIGRPRKPSLNGL